MSKSQQKRICVQSECAVREELRTQLDQANTTIDKLRKSYKDIEQSHLNERVNLKATIDKLLGHLEEAANVLDGCRYSEIPYVKKYRAIVKEVRGE